MLRWLGVGWAVVCLVVASQAAAQMYVTFAPRGGRTGDAAAELAGLERAREYWVGGVWGASAMLAACGTAVAALAWGRRADPVTAADRGPVSGS
jgi:hypothetical protein